MSDSYQPFLYDIPNDKSSLQRVMIHNDCEIDTWQLVLCDVTVQFKTLLLLQEAF